MNPQTIAALAIAAICFAAGWVSEGWRKDAEIAGLQATQRENEARAADEYTTELVAAVHRGDQLQRQVAAAETERDTLAQEKNDAVRRLTVGRPCLDSAVVRVLNRAPSLKPAAVPEAASEPVHPDAAFATDTDVGLWIGQCQRSYDTCRGRLDAIGDFYQEEN